MLTFDYKEMRWICQTDVTRIVKKERGYSKTAILFMLKEVLSLILKKMAVCKKRVSYKFFNFLN